MVRPHRAPRFSQKKARTAVDHKDGSTVNVLSMKEPLERGHDGKLGADGTVLYLDRGGGFMTTFV